MRRREFMERVNQIDPEEPGALDALSALFEEDYVTAGEDLNNAETIGRIISRTRADLEYYMSRYDLFQEKINTELRKAGATEAQINWGLFGNVELPTIPYLRCNHWAKKLIRCSYQILYCLAELKLVGRYSAVDEEELKTIQMNYGRKYG